MKSTVIKTDNDISTYPVVLTGKQVNLLIEALLFSSSVNVCSDWTENDYTDMIDLAKALKTACTNNINLEHLTFIKEKDYEDKWTNDLLKTFNKHLNIINSLDFKNEIN